MQRRAGGIGLGGGEDDRDARGQGIRLERRTDGVAVQLRHHRIEQNQVRGGRATRQGQGQGQGLRSVGGHPDRGFVSSVVASTIRLTCGSSTTETSGRASGMGRSGPGSAGAEPRAVLIPCLLSSAFGLAVDAEALAPDQLQCAAQAHERAVGGLQGLGVGAAERADAAIARAQT
jgi:hypothetical protein